MQKVIGILWIGEVKVLRGDLPSNSKVVVVHSGGVDSTTLLHDAMVQFEEVKALSFHYGQRHVKELQCAERICDWLGVDYRVANLSNIRGLLGGSALTDDVEVPVGHYTEERLKATVVPNRNAIMLSVAMGWAISLEYGCVAYGAHADDSGVYPDCRPEFVEAMSHVASLCHFEPLKLWVPYLEKEKWEIVKVGGVLGTPYVMTWSCYKGGEKHCGRCSTCIARKGAFELAGVPDPTEYEECE